MGENLVHISKDVLLGTPIVTIIGKTEVHVENIKSLIEYDENMVRVKLKTGMLEIKGRKLLIDYYEEDEIHIRGVIEEVLQ